MNPNLTTNLPPAILEMIEQGNAQLEAKRIAKEKAEREKEERAAREQTERDAEFLEAAGQALPAPLRPYLALRGNTWGDHIARNTNRAEAILDLGPDYAEIGFTLDRHIENNEWTPWAPNAFKHVYTVYSYIFQHRGFTYDESEPQVVRHANGYGTAEWTNDLNEALAHAARMGEIRQAKHAEMQVYLERERAEMQRAAEPITPQIWTEHAFSATVTVSEPTTEQKFTAVLKDLIRENFAPCDA